MNYVLSKDYWNDDKTDLISYRFLENASIDNLITSQVEILFCIKGKLIVFNMDDQYDLSEGQAIIIFPNHLHSYKSVGSNSKFAIISFLPDVVFSFKTQILSFELQNPVFDYCNNKTIFSLFKEITDNYKSKTESTIALLVGFVNVLMYSVFDGLKCIQTKNNPNGLLTKVLNYCMLNYSDEITIEKIAKEFSSNPNLISSIFNANMGIGIPKYVNSLRVFEACRLLKATDYNIAQISGIVGFGSIRNLNREFKNIIGITPIDYRSTYRLNNYQ